MSSVGWDLLVAMINLHTKFEVSVFTHYEDMKGNAKCRNWIGLGVRGHPRSPAMSPFYRAHTTSYSTLIELCVYRVPFSTYSELCVKSRRLSPTPFAFDTPVGGDSVRIHRDL